MGHVGPRSQCIGSTMPPAVAAARGQFVLSERFLRMTYFEVKENLQLERRLHTVSVSVGLGRLT